MDTFRNSFVWSVNRLYKNIKIGNIYHVTGNTAIFGDNIKNHEEYWYPYKKENERYVIDYESKKQYMLLMNIAIGGFFTTLNPNPKFIECTMTVENVEVKCFAKFGCVSENSS